MQKCPVELRHSCPNTPIYAVKAENGRLSKLQEYHQEQIKNSGGVAAVVKSVDEVKEIFEKFPTGK
ncbi:hypothetical protein [Aliarcobacter butzleri]|uniref:hypothetical protein n=1 Tax=Aliarcobacter butzleri TaxID=28197 RepID=UPI00125FE6D0|nr:hypothetical protein [Aliarcobacter butzleri]